MTSELALALVCFLLPHAIPSLPGLKSALIKALSRKGYLFLYVLISVLTFIWLIIATLRAPYVELWRMQPWMIYVAVVMIAASCILLITGLITPNPLSLSLRKANPEEPHPAILSYTRHPLLWGFGLWGLSHVLVNGDIAAIILFGILAVFALGYIPLMDHRMQRTLGKAQWRALSHNTSALLFGSLLMGRFGLLWDRLLAIGVVSGLAVFFVLLFLHEPVIGFDPLALIR